MEVMIVREANSKDRFSRWLIGLAFVISVFAFSGYTGPQNGDFQNDPETELLLSGESQYAKIWASLSTRIGYATAGSSPSIAYDSQRNAQVNCNRRFEATFKCLTNQFVSYGWSLTPVKIKIKRSSPQSEDDLPNFLLE